MILSTILRIKSGGRLEKGLTLQTSERVKRGKVEVKNRFNCLWYIFHPSFFILYLRYRPHKQTGFATGNIIKRETY